MAWNPDFLPWPGGAVFDHEKQKLAVVSRFTGQLDVFIVGFDNRVWSTFWNASFEPKPQLSIQLRAIQVSGEGRFVEVTGQGFTPGKAVKLNYDIFSGGGPTTHEFGEELLTSEVMAPSSTASRSISPT
ncbi:hypothetical protein [Streptomyces sp. NPDC052042]|uniref:hypothetical protein n=1 Tax=Streptomyces sp. NPDC052042 TaxID=3365683 RepID=UPI0037CCE302